MQLSQVVETLKLRALTPLSESEVSGGYASDLLSDVLANGQEGDLWITIQAHRNVAAVAGLKGF
ncbi:MAG TPA: serine kinase, partial [Armatimonadota bacterium]|nr:serine kinase [Armatimonadota bacterium]